MNKFYEVLKFAVLFIWQLPQNLIALLMMPFLGKLTFISYKKECFAFIGEKMKGGISLGCFAFVSQQLTKRPENIAHEQEGHTVDSKIYGPLYIFIIGIPSLLHAWLHTNCPCYYHFYTEKLANKHANLKVLYTSKGRCFLKFKD